VFLFSFDVSLQLYYHHYTYAGLSLSLLCYAEQRDPRWGFSAEAAGHVGLRVVCNKYSENKYMLMGYGYGTPPQAYTRDSRIPPPLRAMPANA